MRKKGLLASIFMILTFQSQLFGIFGLECVFSRFRQKKEPYSYQPLIPYQWRNRDPFALCQVGDLDSNQIPFKITCQEHIKSLKIYGKNVKKLGPVAKEFYWDDSFKHRPEEMPIFEWLKFWFRKRLRIY